VFNAHPSAAKCAAVAVRAYNEAIYRETGIENIACIIEKPTLDSFNALCKNETCASVARYRRTDGRQSGDANR
jgi:aldehyde dehydrogenase